MGRAVRRCHGIGLRHIGGDCVWIFVFIDIQAKSEEVRRKFETPLCAMHSGVCVGIICLQSASATPFAKLYLYNGSFAHCACKSTRALAAHPCALCSLSTHCVCYANLFVGERLHCGELLLKKLQFIISLQIATCQVIFPFRNLYYCAILYKWS